MIKQLLKKMRIPFIPLLRRMGAAPAILLDEYPDHPLLFTTYLEYLRTGHRRVPGGWMYENVFYPDYITVGGASSAIERTALQFCKGKGIDVGAWYWPLRGSTPVDIASGAGMQNKIEDIPPNSQDYVFSSHCLEHIADWEQALDAWIGKLKKGGILFLYLPHPSCGLWKKTNPMMAAHHVWTPAPDIIAKAMKKRKMKIVDTDDGPDHFYSFYVCAKK